MADVNATGLEGGAVQLTDQAVQGLAAQLQGTLFSAQDEGYDEARTIWNAMIDKRPALIAMCETASDVQHAVRFAAQHGLLTAVCGGGHNVAGNAVCDGGLMINLTRMNSVNVDADARIANVGPGCTLGELDAATQAHALVVPGGIISETGVAGLTLGGGFGWISRSFGMTIDNLLSVNVVTASGELLTASDTENADLFWGLRGGGGNFGVVTNFEFKLQPLGPEIFCGLIVYPFSEAAEVLRFYREFAAAAPRELTVWGVTRKAPPLPFLNESVHGQLVQVLACAYTGDPAEGERLLKPLREFGNPHGEHLGMAPFTGWQAAFDGLQSAGSRNYWKSHNFDELNDGAIATLIEYIQTAPSDHCEVFIAQLGGAIEDVGATDTAYNHRSTPFLMNVHTRWDDAARDDAAVAWARGLFEAAAPFASGSVYVNFVSNEGSQRVHEAYPAEVWDRLVALKAKYDPNNLFRMNQNIPPAG